MNSSDLAALAEGVVLGAAPVLIFFVIFSTVVTSLTLPPERIAEMPKWFQNLSVIRRARVARLYYAVAGTAFLALSLFIPVGTVASWNQEGSAYHVAAVVSWAGIIAWTVLLWRTTGRAGRR